MKFIILLILFYFNFLNAVESPYIIILGNIQDAGSPHIGCIKECCKELFNTPDKTRKVTALGVIDTEFNKKYLFEASPDIATQLKILNKYLDNQSQFPNGIFITHAHIGHYTGLMYLGKESINSSNVEVFAMPRMKSFLENNGPWNQLVLLNNIKINRIKTDSSYKLTNNLTVIPIIVPHRDEYSETVGFKIFGPNKSAVFIPDIDKWSKWDLDIINEVSKVDYAFIDGTFFDEKEVNNRDISEIPHPFVIETIKMFKDMKSSEKSKIHFIHFNHTNPLLNKNSDEYKFLIENGFRIANFLDKFEL